MVEKTHGSPARPRIASIGLAGMLVSFADHLSEPANRAALAFRARLDRETWPGVEETSAALTSVFVGFDPLHLSHNDLTARLKALLGEADWYAAALPGQRRHWRIPTVFGGPLAPQLDEAAELAGVSPAAAAAELSRQRVRVLTIGYAPGQPYLGTLPDAWNIPRQRALTPSVPAGALVLAIRQFVLFTGATPTGWRHVGQSAFRCFRPEAEDPFALRPGDEVSFAETTPEALAQMAHSRDGGAVCEPLP